MNLIRDFTQPSSSHWVESIEHLFTVLRNCNFLERRNSVVWLCDIPRNFFRSRVASPLDQLILLLSWSFYNSKSSKPNRLTSPFGRKKQKTFSYLSSPCQSILFSQIARFLTPQSFCWNLSHTGKDEFAIAAPTEGSGTSTPIPAMSHAFTSAPALPLALAVAFALAAANSAAKYSPKDF